MGRSKFPGKPSKHVNRTRINVLSTDLAYVTTVVDDTNNATVVTVVQEVSKKDDKEMECYVLLKEPEPPDNKNSVPKTKTTRVSLNKLAAHKKNILLIESPLNSSTQRLTRSKVVSRRSFTFTNRKVNKPKLRISPKKETPNLVGKFVLPSRSIHSSRVIKPNKRFINVEQGEVRIIKKRVLNKRQCVNKSVVEKDCNKTECDKNVEIIENITQVSKITQSPQLNRRVVLRKARLQIKSKTPLGPEGPFSISTNVVSQPATVTCGVCGAIRFYRFVKQARKFNIYSCESCRKFIAKQIQTSNNKSLNTTLHCHKGQGMCHVPPIVRSQQWKFNKLAYNSRCPACWLKLCLRSFQMPMALKTSLSQLLPKNMQICDTLFTSSLPLLTWQSQTSDNKLNEIPIQSTPIQLNDNNTLRQRPVRNIKKDEKPVSVAAPVDIKRPKIDTKGPRVKHVCRSASIVLGQPLAVFPDDKVVDKIKTESEKVKICNKVIEANNIVALPDPIIETEAATSELIPSENGALQPEVENLVTTEENVIPINPIILKPSYIKTENIVQQPIKKEKSKNAAPYLSMLPFEMTKPSFSKKIKPISKQIDTQNLIDIHYWENYDPDEVICNGLGIMSSERFPMQAICFLCGSAGKGTLLHCCSCCEPYHPHCLEQPPNFKNTKQKYTWICPKCTACAACDDTDRQKIQCQKCHKSYHPQCFNTKWRTDDRPTVCSNCLRCKSCGTDNITKFIGNLALCLLCFKLRNKGNYCPLCQCCYDDNDFDTKMMECGKCYKWVHAKCEGLSDEQYQILSILPESVEFLCCLCINKNTPQWRKAIQSELKSCFNNILRLLSKHKIVREMLKLSPLKAYNPTPKQLNSARRLQFTDSEEDTEEPLSEIDTDLERVKDIFKNKIDFGESFKNIMTSSKVPCSPNMLELRNKLNCTEYFSLREFNESMEHALESTDSDELIVIYRTILKNVFPWFDPTVKQDANQSVCEVSMCKPEEDEEDAKFKYDFFDVSVTNKLDNRVCSLCKGVGDGLPICEARLLYCGHNVWVHSNCALWSSEVYEEIDGSLQNVQGALSRGRSIRCTFCKQKGASVGCCLKGCKETYHFPCAQKSECIFIADKTIYCKTHDIGQKFNVVQNSMEFEIRRSVYVEVDCKKNKLCEPEKVNYMVGSLSVYNLGKVIPNVSDNIEAIIPVGFVCSRLFWSTTEPWKLVSYKITTSLFNKNAFVYVDKNYTVDHTLPKNMVEKKLREISAWMKDDKEKSESAEFDFEEPQSSADILSPELTDAILEELPHDLLDGITWTDQDMLMGYEELLNMDFKNAEINYNDLNMNADNSSTNLVTKPMKIDEKVMKLEKSSRNQQQRSCGLTWLQLDQNLSPAMKKRKVMPPRDKSVFMPPIIQVDGGCDSSGSECGSPTHESEQVWTLDVSEQPVTCEKCQLTYRTNASYNRHLETCCDSILTSESETENEMYVVTETHETLSSHAGALQNSIKVQENPYFYNFQQTGEMKMTHTQTQSTPEIYCVVAEKNSIAINQPMMNNAQVIGMMDQSNMQQSLNIQQMPFAQDLTHLLNPQMNQNLTINKMLTQNVQTMPQNQWIRPIIKTAQQNKTRARIVVKKPGKMQASYIPHSSQSVILQHLPNMQNTTNMQNILPFVDLDHQQQNVQYITTLAPQINSTITTQAQLIGTQQQMMGNQAQFIGNQTQLLGNQAQIIGNQFGNQALVQLPGDNNFLSLVPNMQPMIIQQPNNNGQIILDANGSMVWAPHPVQQVQPIYYGFETIVQNTVMQSQQFLPTTVPGVLATNSSYSATTQVFQTSKLEPVMDNSGFVLVNNQNGMHQIVNQNTQMQSAPQSNVIAESPNLQNTAPILQNVQNTLQRTQQTIIPTSTVAVQNSVSNTENMYQQPNPQPILQSAQSIEHNLQAMPAQSIEHGLHNIQVNTERMQPDIPQPITQSIHHNTQAIEQKLLASTNIIESRPLNIQSVSQSTPIITSPLRNTIRPTAPTLLQTCAQRNLTCAQQQPQRVVERVPSTAPTLTRVAVAKRPVSNGPPPIIINGAQKPRSWSVQKVATSKSHEMLNASPQVVASNMKFAPIAGANPNAHNNSISLPIAPFIRVPEQGIPTNIVTPTPKPAPSGPYRPMSRVLPMQTIASQLKKQDKIYQKEMSAFSKQATPKVRASNNIDRKDDIRENQLITILEDVVIKPSRAALTEQTLEAMRLEFKEVKPKEIIVPHEVEIKDLIKLNKLQIAQLKPLKPKLVKTDNKENASIEFNADVPDKVDDKLQKKAFKIENDLLDDAPKQQQKRTNPNTIYYKIESADGVDYSGSSLALLWSKVFNDVQAARLEHNLPPLPEAALRSFCGFELLGLKSKGMKYLIEQLPDAVKCKNYKHRFRKPSSMTKFDEEDYEEYSRRCLPYDAKPRKKYDMFSWLSSKYRTLEMYDWDSIPKKTTSSASMSTRHKTMTAISKYSVGVYRSEIHGRGLFSLRDIESGDMVIEYCGEVIRSALTDKRERFYTEKSIGCYMFRIDDNLVVDATMKGNSARFINHSCDPNCYSKVVEISGDKHIIIFALRKIICGEELTYDYKFPFEDDKIPCSCGTRRCRKFLN